MSMTMERSARRLESRKKGELNDFEIHLATSPRLLDANGVEVGGLRKKDLALLTYFWVSGVRRHQRSSLASLLWANRPEAKARHSLTQALRRIHEVVGDRFLQIGQSQVEWHQSAPAPFELVECSKTTFEELRENSGAGLFLDGFIVGAGAQEFDTWLEQKRRGLKTQLSNHLKIKGREAEHLANWDEALRLAECAVSLDPFDEEAHRRIMTAWSALGQKSRALRHYEQLVEFLMRELDETPDPASQEVRRLLKSKEQ